MTHKSKTKKIVAGVLGLMLSLTLVAGVGAQTANAALSTSQVDAIVSLLTSFGADAGTISNVRASLTGGTPSAPTTGGAMTGSGYTFTRNLKQGDVGEDVRQLQTVLNMDSATQVAASGVGSKGMESTAFGPATKAAVVKFQNKYSAEILTPVGLTSGTGSVGASTRAKLNSMSTGSPVVIIPGNNTGTPPVVVPMGGGLTVSKAPVQPTAQLAPLKAARVPFTKVTFTAGASDATVNGLVVERGGQAVDSVFDSIILLDETGMQVGLSKTLNSQHQTTLTQPFVVKAGTTRTMTIAANRPTSETGTPAGMVPTLSLVQVNTSATVSGSFPIVGTAQTINSGLTIGSATVNRGSLDPGTSVTKEVGVTNYNFSSIRVTAGSGENLRLKSIRFNQTESASASDLANIKIYVDGTAYDPVVTDGGQYYVASFGSGLVIEKGFSKEISIKGDVIGGSGRKADFDIAKRTDIDLTGELYGYGIMPDFGSSSTADDSQVHSADDYYFDGSVLTIDNGSMNVSTSNASPAQNIAVNTQNQPFGSFIVDVKGEAITVARLAFNVTLGNADSNGDIDDLTNITIVDENGSVVAGPVDGDASDSSYTTSSGDGSVVFSDTITFPVGQHTYFLKGKVGTDIDNNNTITASTTPSTDFATVRGLTTGKTITPAPASALTFGAMTVKSGALTVSSLGQPPAQTIVAGGKQVEFARYTLDGNASGEDIRVTTIPLDYSTNGTATDLTNCQLRDGSKTGTSLTTGSNVKNPTAVSSTTTFTFDGNGVIVSKGTSKTLSLTCDIKSGTTSVYYWGLTATADNGSWTGATGLASAQTITEVFNRNIGLAMTATSGGSYTVSADSSSAYNYRAVKAGTMGVPLAAFKFEAGLAEEITLKQVALQLGNVASNSPADLVDRTVTLWVDGVNVGTAQFGANGDYATSTLSTTVKLGKGPSGAKTVVVKGDLRTHDANTNSTSVADEGGYGSFLAVTYDGNNVTAPDGNYATGVDSGGNITGYSTDVTTNGVRVFKNVPTVRITNLGANTLVTGDPVYKFTITNPDSGSDMLLYKVSYSISTSGPTGFRVTAFELRGDGVLAKAATTEATDVKTAGLDVDALEFVFDASSEARRIPAGSSKEYILSGTASGMAAGTNSLNVKLNIDTAYPSLGFLMGKAGTAGVNITTPTASGFSSSTNNFIWSPVSTTTFTTAATYEAQLDWTNGYGIPIYDKNGSLVAPTGSVATQASEKSI